MKLLIFGGTGSLGKALISSLKEEYDIFVFSRDEAKHVNIKQLYPFINSLIGDIRDKNAVFSSIINVSPDIIINAAALKNVPETEAVPMEAVKTNLLGTENLLEASTLFSLAKDKKLKILSISTDKACKPVNSYGMAKALQERVHVRANGNLVICNAVRYGNVLESRGSVIPIIKSRIKKEQDLYITDRKMTRFFMTLTDSVNLIKTALKDNEGGKVFIPQVKSAKIIDLLEIFCEKNNKPLSIIKHIGIRPGEKVDEILISLEEAYRTETLKDIFVLHGFFEDCSFSELSCEYSSGNKNNLMSKQELSRFLVSSNVIGK